MNRATEQARQPAGGATPPSPQAVSSEAAHQAQHTPGPWEAEHGADSYFYVTHDGGMETQNPEADACLIAAAPDLLRALKMCVIERSEWLDEARAAIAKARGGVA